MTQKEKIELFRSELGFSKKIAYWLVDRCRFNTPDELLQNLNKYDLFKLLATYYDPRKEPKEDIEYGFTWSTGSYRRAVTALNKRGILLSESQIAPAWVMNKYELYELFYDAGIGPDTRVLYVLENEYGVKSIEDLCNNISKSILLSIKGCSKFVVDEVIKLLSKRSMSLKAEEYDVLFYDSLPLTASTKRILQQKGFNSKDDFARLFVGDLLNTKGITPYAAYVTQKELEKSNIHMITAMNEWNTFVNEMDDAFAFIDAMPKNTMQDETLTNLFHNALICYMKAYKF